MTHHCGAACFATLVGTKHSQRQVIQTCKSCLQYRVRDLKLPLAISDCQACFAYLHVMWL